MKFKIINPDWGMTEEQMEQRCRILADYTNRRIQLSMECLAKTKVSLDSPADLVRAGPEILQMAIQAEQEGYDAVILYCFSDPVMEACRQAVSIPVVGAGQAACLLLPAVAYHGALLVADQNRIPEKRMALSRTGLASERICGYEPVHARGLDPIEHRGQLKKELLKAGQRALEHTEAQALILGCLSFLGLAEELSAGLMVPVIDPGPASVCLAETLVCMHLRSSPRAYPPYPHF